MASNREERLQMRQRGAGTRKIKEVNFGFSLGFGPPPIEEPSQSATHSSNDEFHPAPAPQPLSLRAPPPILGIATSKPAQAQSTPSPTRTNTPSQNRAVQRTPGSARNRLPPRPSTFDIPAEDKPELERTSKRRRIEPPTILSPSIGARPETREVNTSQNGIIEESIPPSQDETIAIPNRTSTSNQAQLLDQEPPAEVPLIPTHETNEGPPEGPDEAHERLETENAEHPVPEPPRVNGNASPTSDTTKGKSRGRGKKGRPSPPQSNVSNPELAEPVDIPPTQNPQPPEPAEAPQERISPETKLPKTREQRTRSRTPASVQASENPIAVDKPPVEDATSEAMPSGTTGKGLRGRKKKILEPTEGATITTRGSESSALQAEKELEHNHVSPRGSSTSAQEQPTVDKSKKRAGRPKKQASQSPEPPKQSHVGSRKRQREERERQAQANTAQEEPDAGPFRAGKRRKQREGRESTPRQEDQAEPTPQVEPSRAGRRKQREERESIPHDEQPEPDAEPQTTRAGKRKQREVQEPTQEREEQPEPEPEIEPEPQPEREQPKSAKRRRGRRPTIQPDEPTQDNAAEERPQATKRKPRQPRGDTVPVTVHRLANSASLGGAPLGSVSDDDADLPDEIASNQTNNLPSRGGVNAADVLAQICRETLEKTLTTLKNGIATEANTARRAEWTLRRKAVEAFGSELEGRLFDLSEMLDSNFMLSANLKKAKRNMMDLRSRLDHVRREREAVALRMDTVRREHAREEQAGTTRSTINHSLHNLDLALERGQGRRTATSDEPLTAGLEFRLRNMAQRVSSTAPGAQGGLLNQIKSFNAQLEATAQQLEG